MRLVESTAAALLVSSTATFACVQGETCEILSGQYGYEAPADRTGPLPVILYFHGYGSTSENTLAVDRVLVDTAINRGYAFIALNGQARSFAGAKNGWSVRDGQDPLRSEPDFARDVLNDLSQYADIDRHRVLVMGYSLGASAVLDMACHSPEGFAAFSTLNGAMWNPLPEACAEPVHLLHTHAFSDEVMPLEGLSYGPVSTGDVFKALQLIREVSVDDHTPDAFTVTSDRSCRSWDGATVEFCLYDGGHTWPLTWMTYTLDWFEQHARD